ncbi:MAG: alkaline phosphatase family protein [Verrucomicrobia bacterium]|nr:alkaline phosphatase family protein [Verrucomicrobiota bacterium]
MNLPYSVRRTAILFAVLVAAWPAVAANRDRHVVLITLDGFPAYLWRDPSIPLPNLRRLAAEGAVADAMTISNPAITWPNHTTLVTGVTPRQHGVLYNGLATRQGPGKPVKIEPWVDKALLVRVPTVYDAAFNAGLTTAEVDWVAITRPKTITWSFAELPDPAATLPQEMIAAGIATADEVEAARSGRRNIVWRDELWTRAACFVFARHQPNLLLFHPLNTDSTHHRFGPGSLASISALALADHLVGQLLRAIDASGRRAQTTVIVTTDHGFKKVEHYIYPNVVLKQAGLLRATGPTIAQCDAYTGTQGGIAFVYVTDPDRRAELVPKLKELFARTAGVDRVLDGAEAPSLGMPTPGENPAMGELILFPKAGYAFTGAATGDIVTGPAINYGGTHGYASTDPELDGIFLASGAGIRKGMKLDRVNNLDVAPTIARLLGIALPTAQGRAMEQMFEGKP